MLLIVSRSISARLRARATVTGKARVRFGLAIYIRQVISSTDNANSISQPFFRPGALVGLASVIYFVAQAPFVSLMKRYAVCIPNKPRHGDECQGSFLLSLFVEYSMFAH